MTDETNTDAPEEWALIEIMGHQQSAGRIQEVTRFGASMLRVDRPFGEGFVTKFYGGASIYALTPCTEEVARAAAARLYDPRPVAPMDFRLEDRSARPTGYDTNNTFDDDDMRPF